MGEENTAAAATYTQKRNVLFSSFLTQNKAIPGLYFEANSFANGSTRRILKPGCKTVD